jgi:hypothetical protein
VRTTDECEVERVVDQDDGHHMHGSDVGDKLRARVARVFEHNRLEGTEVEIKVADAVKTMWEYRCRETEKGVQVVEGEGCVAVHQGNNFGIAGNMSVCLLLQY